MRNQRDWSDLNGHLASFEPVYEQQNAPLALDVLFSPDEAALFDVGWVPTQQTYIQAGDPILHAFSVEDGRAFVQTMMFPVHVVMPLAERNDKIKAGDPLATVEIRSLQLSRAYIKKIHEENLFSLAQATNAVVKGFFGSIGQGGQVTNNVVPLKLKLKLEEGVESLTDQLAIGLSEIGLEHGDIVVVSEKVVSVAQQRLFPLNLLYDDDPKLTALRNRQALLEKVREYVPSVVEKDLLLSDSLIGAVGGDQATAGINDANGVAHALAEHFSISLGVDVDVVISDTDTGLDVRETIINTITIGATPIGATAGVSLYECMRLANAAEFVRGSHRNIPVVIAKPHLRRRKRTHIGEHRGYMGYLDACQESLIGFA